MLYLGNTTRPTSVGLLVEIMHKMGHKFVIINLWFLLVSPYGLKHLKESWRQKFFPEFIGVLKPKISRVCRGRVVTNFASYSKGTWFESRLEVGYIDRVFRVSFVSSGRCSDYSTLN
jgi:hypothetical protein